MIGRLVALGAVVLVVGCAATVGVAVDAVGARRLCPDGRPVRILQDPACGQACGYSCLPDRWAGR